MMIESRDIAFHYDPAHPLQIPDIALQEGEELLILGKSGSGKTTVLNILGGLVKPLKGRVEIGGTDIYQLKNARLDKFRGTHIGIVFQKPHLLTPLTVGENLAIAQYFSGETNGAAIDKVLKDLGISHKKDVKVNTLSEGEAQRVSIARAMVNGPQLILADEPTASLDDENAEAVIQLLKEQTHKLRAALVVVTHDQRVKAHFSNQIIMGGTI